MNMIDTKTGVVRYVGYDTTTGRIVHTHSEFSVAENKYVTIPLEDLKAQFSADPTVVSRVRDGNPDHLDFIKVESHQAAEPIGRLCVDPEHRTLVLRPHLALSSTSSELVGDGDDQAEIVIVLTRGHGRVHGATGDVRVTTTRGRLSARGGVVSLVDGRATIGLTAANETVRRVRVTAAAVDAVWASGHLELEFV